MSRKDGRGKVRKQKREERYCIRYDVEWTCAHDSMRDVKDRPIVLQLVSSSTYERTKLQRRPCHTEVEV